MGIIKAFDGAITGVFADQWKDIITVDGFSETVACKPGVWKSANNGRGVNWNYSDGVISNGSKIYVPEGTVAYVFDNSGIETIVDEPGGYTYSNGETSFFNGDGLFKSVLDGVSDRIGFAGQPSNVKRVAFVNLREIRNLKFGTRGPMIYHDKFYDVDLEIIAHGTYTIQIIKPDVFLRRFLPANVFECDFANREVTSELVSELLESLIVALNKMSDIYRVSELPAHAKEITDVLASEDKDVGTWEERYGFKLVALSVRNIELTDGSRELIQQYASTRMSVSAFENISQSAGDIAYKQKVGEGVKEHGFGDGAGIIMGMNVAQDINSNRLIEPGQEGDLKKATVGLSIDEQIETIKKLKELMDAGLLTQDEFELKKKEVMKL